jgi:glycolate oxidase
VLPTGEVVSTGGRFLKDVAGYNLTQLLVGSEGTLAIVTRAICKLIPRPRFQKSLLVPFGSLEDAARAVGEILRSGVLPQAVEFMERNALLTAVEHLGRSVPHQEAEAQLLIALDGNSEDLLDAEIETIGEAVMACGAVEVLLADDPRRQEELWSARNVIGEAVKKISAYKEEDTVVPRSRLPELIRGVRAIAEKYAVRAVCYGHAGDGNIHVNVIKTSITEERWREIIGPLTHEIFGLTVGLGGTITGEHGVGLSQKDSLGLVLSRPLIEIHHGIKRLFDPNLILNPGKIFDL